MIYHVLIQFIHDPKVSEENCVSGIEPTSTILNTKIIIVIVLVKTYYIALICCSHE